MIFRKVLNQGYRTVMGTAPPDPMNPKQPILRAAAWAAVTAASAAVVEVLVMRFATGSGVEQDHEQSLQTGPAGVS